MSSAKGMPPAELVLRPVVFGCVLLVRLLPPSWFGWFATCLVVIAGPFLRTERRNLRRNVHRILDLPPHSEFSRTFEKQVIRHQVIAGLEALRASWNPDLVRFEGLEAYGEYARKTFAGGRGFVVVTAHAGCWEFVATTGARVSGRPFHALAKPAPFPFLTRRLEAMRKRQHVNILWTNGPRILRDMLACLKSGNILGFVMDQKPENRQGHKVPFFGRPTDFVSGPARMALKTSSPVLGVFCMRTGPWRYRIICEELFHPDNSGATEAELTASMAGAIEKIVQNYPEQWTWNYRRWKFTAPSS